MSAAAVWSVLQESRAPRAGDERVAPVQAVLRRVLLLLERRSAWLGSPARQARAQTFSAALNDRDAERSWLDETPSMQALERELRLVDAALESDRTSLLRGIVSAFALSESECDALHVCLALAIEPRLSTAFACLRDDPEQTQASEALVAELTGRRLPFLAKGGGILGWGILRAGESDRGQPAPLSIDPYILDFACGAGRSDSALTAHETRISSVEALPAWPIQQVAARAAQALALGTPLRITLRGPRGSGRASFAALVANALGRGVLAIDTSGVRDDAWAEVYLRAQRQARLTGACIVWRGAHVTRQPPPCPGLSALQFVTGDIDLTLASERGIAEDTVSMPSLGVHERSTLFKQLVPESEAWGESMIEDIATRYRVQIADIVAIGRRGIARAEDAREACRAATRHRLGELGQQLDCPFTRQDLTLSAKLDAVLDDLMFEARERIRFWEAPGPRRLFPRGRGLVALMAGPPGTGKTMAAQVIASELGLDLFRVDLASVVNKYIGETAKNLRRIFARASEMSAVLLFDEADALFSKRTDVKDSHDRYANADTNYLLQLLEDFEGIALLASNKMGNIDAAFTRRIRYVLEFRAPEAGERFVLWKRIVGELAGSEVEQAVQAQLRAAAELVELSGAQIKLAALSAVLVSRRGGEPLRGAHLCVGLQRELGKTGRNLGERERSGIERHDN